MSAPPPLHTQSPNPFPPPPPPPPEPLTGFRSALEHTGLPRSVLLWKPRLPSRNWTIFLTIVSTVSYIYYDDRRQCRLIRDDYIKRVKGKGMERMDGSLGVVRKVKVMGARWGEDDDEDRALRYFRKYVKPYLVAAAVDYEQIPAPLHGSITRQVHAAVLKKRRQSLGVEPSAVPMSLPGIMDPREMEKLELEGGFVLVGRASLKEYMEGLRRGWMGGVDEWEWEQEVEERLRGDGVFEGKPEQEDVVLDQQSTPAPSSTPSLSTPPPASLTGLSFLSRPQPPAPTATSLSPTPAEIPAQYHTPPSPLPPQPPILLLPFVSHLGFRQIPSMIYDFFTERHRVLSGAQAALSLIEGKTRPFRGPDESPSDVDFDRSSEEWYKKSFAELPSKIETARRDYYTALEPRLIAARELASGKREMTDAEKKSTKPAVTEDDLREERRKKELRWQGQVEGYEIVRPEQKMSWDESWKGWLRVYALPEEKEGGSLASASASY